MISIIRVFAIGLAIVCVHVQSALAMPELVSHRAFYSVSMAPGDGDSAVAGIDGIMTMSLEKTCDGWIFTQDMSTIIALHDGGSFKQTALFTSWESLDGRSYRFASRLAAGEGQEIIRGNALINAEGNGTAHYSEPTDADVPLPKGTLFPVSHTAWVIDEAEQGSRFASRVVFTGSEELEPEIVNAFIGDVVDENSPEFGSVENLESKKGWPLTLAFHSISSQSSVPTFEMRAFQLDNGIAPSLEMNFGSISTMMTIERLEHIEHPMCD